MDNQYYHDECWTTTGERQRLHISDDKRTENYGTLKGPTHKKRKTQRKKSKHQQIKRLNAKKKKNAKKNQTSTLKLKGVFNQMHVKPEILQRASMVNTFKY